jgi:hypothetical protein
MVNSRMLILGLLVCGALSVGLFCGCEDGPDTENVDSQFDNSATTVGTSGTTAAVMVMVITPSTVTLSTDGAVAAFAVSDASSTVTWSVQDISKGSILTQSDRTATYQRSAAGDNVVIATAGGTAVFATVSQPL